MYTEKIKIIKAHILSLQKKEEELAKKNMTLNKKDNFFSRKKSIGENNESD